MHWLTTAFQSMSRPLKWWVVIASWEQGIRIRLGKTTKRLDPGPHFRIPFFDRIYVQSVRLRITHAKDQSISTKDGVIVTFSIALQYQISDIVKLYQTVASVEAVLLFKAISRASSMISTSVIQDLNPKQLEDMINLDMPGEEYGLDSVRVSVISFCTARCYRLITGDSWVPSGPSVDEADTSGEIK